MRSPDCGGSRHVRNREAPADEGARRIASAVEALSRFARENAMSRAATGDRHSMEHREIARVHRDDRKTFPPHDMADQAGSEKSSKIELRDPLVLPRRAGSALA